MYTPQNLSLWTLPASYFGEHWPDYYVFLGQHRDSDSLARSNFICGLKAIGGECDGDDFPLVTIVRESHWAVGWVEWIAIHKTAEAALRAADEIKARLEEYPVVDEDHWGELEFDEMADAWESMSPRDKVREAIWQRDRCHWLSSLPVWRFGRMSFYDLGNQTGDYHTIASAIEESLRA